jgi:hypothetical protein
MTSFEHLPLECTDMIAKFICEDETWILRDKKDVLSDVFSLMSSSRVTKHLAVSVKKLLWKESFPNFDYPTKEFENYVLIFLKEIIARPWIELNRVSSYYLLKPNDRTGLRTTIQFEYGNRWGTRYWWSHAVIIACLRKYGSIKTWSEERERLEKEREKRLGRKRTREEERKRELELCLKQRGCELRSDSVLCREYIENKKGDCREIAVIMEEMKFYHTHTDYSTIYQEIANRQKEYLGSYDAESVSESAKRFAFEKWKSKFPASCVAKLRHELPNSLRKKI